jgi:hypothetical protein
MLNKILKFKYNFNPILHNRIILYVFFAIALFDLLYFLNNKDMYSFSALILIGILTSFFNKNMIVILFVSIILTHILKYGQKSYTEGLEGMKEGETGDYTKKDSEDNTTDDDNSTSDSKNDKLAANLNKLKEFTSKIDGISKKGEGKFCFLKNIKRFWK